MEDSSINLLENKVCASKQMLSTTKSSSYFEDKERFEDIDKGYHHREQIEELFEGSCSAQLAEGGKEQKQSSTTLKFTTNTFSNDNDGGVSTSYTYEAKKGRHFMIYVCY